MWKEHNAKIVAAFRENGGKIPVEVNQILSEIEVAVLTMKGAKSGREYVVPLTAFSYGDDFFVVASGGGTAEVPTWYHNLKKNPRVLVERGREKYWATASLVDDPAERTRLYAETIEVRGEFAAYEQKAGRLIPVFIVQRMAVSPA